MAGLAALGTLRQTLQYRPLSIPRSVIAEVRVAIIHLGQETRTTTTSTLKMRDGLPEELIERILQHVKDEHVSTDFWNCLRTCQQWHRIGLGLYKGLGFAMCVTIDSDERRCDVQEESIDRQFNSQVAMEIDPPSSIYLSLLKSLTLHIRHQLVAPTQQPYQSIDIAQSLRHVFSETTSLTTFSLKFSDGWDICRLDVPAVPGSMLASIVRALPTTVINIELDTAGTELPPCADLELQESHGHICVEISKILHRLKNLRLRIGHLCDALIALKTTTADCGNVRGCDYCDNGEQSICFLVRNWRMRNMVLWLPWGQSLDNNSLAIASEALLDPRRRNPTVVLFVAQSDHLNTARTSITEPVSDPFTYFSWTAMNNVPSVLQEKLPYFRSELVHGRSANLEDTRFLASRADDLACLECERIREVAIRTFIMSEANRSIESGRTTTYSYVAEQTVENMLAWVQSRAFGYRYPVSEASCPGEPFFRNEKLWPCQFPGCHVRSQTNVHLRGHHIYAHPNFAHWSAWEGCQPCPRTGCEHVGENGFKNREAFNVHLREHHRGLCPSVEQARGST